MSTNALKRAHGRAPPSTRSTTAWSIWPARCRKWTPRRDLRGQTREVLGHIDRLLAEAGSDKARILSCQIFLTDVTRIGEMNEVWDAWVPQGNTPPRAHRGGQAG